MKKFIKNRLLKILNLKITIEELEQILLWQNEYQFEDPFPKFLKQKVLQSYSSKDTIWVESGTYMGETAKFLSNISKFVYTLEPSDKYFKLSKEVLSNTINVKIINKSSEEYFEQLLHDIDENSIVSFWLDGHWSGSDTFKGITDTPIQYELSTISKFLNKFKETTVLVDDFRLFNKHLKQNELYPDKNFLINWAYENNLDWNISKDIFIAHQIK